MGTPAACVYRFHQAFMDFIDLFASLCAPSPLHQPGSRLSVLGYQTRTDRRLCFFFPMVSGSPATKKHYQTPGHRPWVATLKTVPTLQSAHVEPANQPNRFRNPSQSVSTSDHVEHYHELSKGTNRFQTNSGPVVALVDRAPPPPHRTSQEERTRLRAKAQTVYKLRKPTGKPTGNAWLLLPTRISGSHTGSLALARCATRHRPPPSSRSSRRAPRRAHRNLVPYHLADNTEKGSFMIIKTVFLSVLPVLRRAWVSSVY